MARMTVLGDPRVRRVSELAEAHSIANELYEFLVNDAVEAELRANNVVGTSSAVIQSILLEKAEALGFQSERKGLFASYASPGLRPDYFRPLGTTGILLEVERGKSLDNNMDILDLWKCHICPAAEYLFLVVPVFRPNGRGRPAPVFERVNARLSTFFREPNYVNVQAAFLFGY